MKEVESRINFVTVDFHKTCSFHKGSDFVFDNSAVGNLTLQIRLQVIVIFL